MNTSPGGRPHLRPVHDALWAVAVVVVSAAAWLAWLGWDTTYWIDPETGVAQGPYRAWQVIGCVLTLLVIALIAAWWWRPFVMAVLAPLAFTVAWSITAARDDETGLWMVGAIMVLIGTGMGALAIAAIITAIRGGGGERLQSGTPSSQDGSTVGS